MSQRDAGNGVRRLIWFVLLAVLLTSCSPARGPAALSSAVATPYGVDHPYPLPPPGGQADYQLGGAYPPPSGTQVVARDWHAAPVPGAYNICYLNALQAQPEDLAWWEANHPDLLVRDGSGAPVMDRDWDEAVLDVSTVEKRAELLAVQSAWIDGCAAAGFDAVEPDNQDVYLRGGSGFVYVVAYLTDFTAYAHSRGLAVAQKNNGPELGTRGRDEIGFDFAIAEECAVWRECRTYVEVYGRYVIEIEYTDQPVQAFAESCGVYGGHHSIVRRDRQLRTPDDPDYSYTAC